MRLEWCERAAEYQHMAREYLEAYNAVASQWPGESFQDQKLLDPKLSLLCHSLELSMKGWLVLHEGLPRFLGRSKKKELEQAGKPVPKTLAQDYSHHLADTATAAGAYYPPLLEHLDTIAHLTISHWGTDNVPHLHGSRDYLYPEGNWMVSYVPPSELAVLVKRCIDSLETAITQACRAILEPQMEGRS